MTTNRILASIAVASFALVGIASSPVSSASPACYEDMACWDPSTMGNHEGSLPDGQVPIPGDYTIVI